MRADATHVTLFTRRGCPWSIRLERRLRHAGVEYRRVDIWDDADGAAFVRSVAGGKETVPTMLIGDKAMVNPHPRTALAAIADLRAVLEAP